MTSISSDSRQGLFREEVPDSFLSISEKLRYIKYRESAHGRGSFFWNLNDVKTRDGIFREKEFP